MPLPILRDDAIRILMPRAMLMWLLVRLAFFAITLVPPGAGDGSLGPPPTGVIFLSGFLAVAEWRRRSERAFWRNFGVSLQQMAGIALVAAALCEFALYILTTHVISDR